jgi:hypothetical protein
VSEISIVPVLWLILAGLKSRVSLVSWLSIAPIAWLLAGDAVAAIEDGCGV